MLISDLPLTQLLTYKKVNCCGNGLDHIDSLGVEDRKLLLSNLKVNVGIPYIPGEGVTISHPSIEELFANSTSTPSILADATYLFGPLQHRIFTPSSAKTGTFKLKYIDRRQTYHLLLDHTSWFGNLTSQAKNAVLDLRESHYRSDGSLEYGTSKLRRVLEAVDHIVIGFFLSGEKRKTIDRITTSILSNLVITGDQGYMTYLKDYKKVVKGLKKDILSSCGEIRTVIPNQYSWIYQTEFYHRCCQLVKNTHPSWEELQHVMVVLQTRSTGLANGLWEEDSIIKWIDTITDTSVDYCPMHLKRGAQHLRMTQTDSGIINLTSAACVEASRRKGGKFQLIKDFIEEIQNNGTFLVDWRTGKFSEEKHFLPKLPDDDQEWPCWLTEELGYYLFSFALYKVTVEKIPFAKVNLATVIEQGKARIVTPGSIYIFLLLMPLSHSTLRALEQIPELRTGVSQTDDAWQFWKRMGPSKEDGKGNYEDVFLCADLETATDYAPWGLVEDTLDIIGKTGSPDWYISLAKKLLCNPRRFRQGDKWHTTARGALMADPVTKTILSLSHWCIIKSLEERYPEAKGAPFAIKGDDVIIKLPKGISQDYFRDYKIAMYESGFKLSPEDTFLSPRYGFYCEGLFRLYHLTKDSPDSWGQMVDQRDPSFCDIPMVKLAFPVYKDNRRIGETPEGKISLLSKKQSWMHPQSFIFYQYEMLNIIQSLTFRLDEYQQDLLYGPRWIGGLSKRPPLGSFDNVMLEDDTKRKLILYYRYAISSTTDFHPRDQQFLLDPSEEKTVKTLSSKFLLRNSNDDFGNLLTYDFSLKMNAFWTSEDDRFWGIPLGERLKDIKGLSSDRSIKSRYLTLQNLSGRNADKQEYIKSLDPSLTEDLNRIFGKQNPDLLQETYQRYQRVGAREYKEIDWQIYIEDDFPLYNAMKVNPSDHSSNNLRQMISGLNRINKSTLSKEEKREQKKELQKELHYSDRDLQVLDAACILRGDTKSKFKVSELQYETASFEAGDSDGRARLELIWLYQQLANLIAANGGTDYLESEEAKRFLTSKDGPTRNLIWVSRDRSRFYSLRRLSESLWLDLELPQKFKRYCKINVLWYLPVGTQEEWGFFLTGAEHKGGKLYNLPPILEDVWESPPNTLVVQDFESLESTAQQLVATGETDASSVKIKNEVYPLGYSKISVPGLLTS